MAALANQRHETFCQLVVQAAKHGWSNSECYQRAGFTCRTPRVAHAAAARLLACVSVQWRIDELRAPTVRKTRATVDTLAAQLDAVFDGATGDRQWGAAGSAAALKAKLLGFMREQIEVGAPGSFAQCESTAEIARKLLNDMGSVDEALAACDALRKAIIDEAALAAEPVN